LGGIENKLMVIKDEEWEVLDRKALGTIWLSLVVLVAINILKEKTMKKLVAKLYEKPLVSNKVFIMNILFNMKISEGGSITYHLNEFNMVTNKLSFVKVDFDNEVRALLISCSFPESLNDMVMVVSNFVSSSNTLEFYDVVGVILSE
jgi:hypothetical protein